jgi:hypothetical protein
LLLVLAVTYFSAVAEQAVTTTEPSSKVMEPAKDTDADTDDDTKRKNYEPASRFVPSEKLRADDTVSFPVDI